MQKLRDQSWLIAAYIRVNNLHYESCMVSGGGGLYLCHQGTLGVARETNDVSLIVSPPASPFLFMVFKRHQIRLQSSHMQNTISFLLVVIIHEAV